RIVILVDRVERSRERELQRIGALEQRSLFSFLFPLLEDVAVRPRFCQLQERVLFGWRSARSGFLLRGRRLRGREGQRYRGDEYTEGTEIRAHREFLLTHEVD